MSNIEQFLQLVKENPDLPIVPMVDSEVVSDDSYVYWMGAWGCSRVIEIYRGREGIHFKDDDEEDVLSDLDGAGYDRDFEGNDIYELSDEAWKKLFESLPWQKAIVIYITT